MIFGWLVGLVHDTGDTGDTGDTSDTANDPNSVAMNLLYFLLDTRICAYLSTRSVRRRV